MSSSYKTPGVYIEEKGVFPSTAVAVNTAVPVFIGYTEKAKQGEQEVMGVPIRITSMHEYAAIFGGAPKYSFTVTDAQATDKRTFSLYGKQKTVRTLNPFLLYNSLRFFYANGGGPCYILSAGDYSKGADTKALSNEGVWTALEKLDEITLVVIPDAVNRMTTDSGNATYDIYTAALAHCEKMQSRFAIFDVPYTGASVEEDVNTFRNGIGINYLKYGAAYYPWLNTTIVPATELSFLDLNEKPDLRELLTEETAKEAIDKYRAGKISKDPDNQVNRNLHLALRTCSPGYVAIMDAVRASLNELPPAAAMAGLYTMVDSTRGVWKAPANISLNLVTAPVINITHEQQEPLNVDVIGGKSINVIRPFPGIGTLVWGGRTLDGNSQDWKYINVRRTMIMIEQSLKLACRAYVFEPNVANTWVSVKCMIENFLTDLWKQGALAGYKPTDAFDVQIGLGATMTATDILEGKMVVNVKVAIVRPAEFIVITFEQQMQQS